MDDGGQKRIIFRADASSKSGGGHVMRCLTLAEEFRAAGWSVGFAANAESRDIIPRLNNCADLLLGTDTLPLDPEAVKRRWPSGCDVFVVDHYDLGASFEKACRDFARHIVVIDDLANRPHDCDLLIDTNFGRRAEDYGGLVPADAHLLIGADYALLRPEFAAHRAEALARRATLTKVDRILVSLGLTDLGGITARVVQPLLEIDGSFSIDVVIGHAAASRSFLEDFATREQRLCLHVDPPDMAALMASADLAIGAGGTTSWERCCLGLPTLVLVLADNQKMIAEELSRAGAAIRLERYDRIDPKAVAETVAHLIVDFAKLRATADRAATICDGAGAAKVRTWISCLE